MMDCLLWEMESRSKLGLSRAEAAPPSLEWDEAEPVDSL